MQSFKGTLCFECNDGYYPLIGTCFSCPDKGGVTAANVGNMVAIYGSIWVLWLVINRFICEELVFMDSILNFCQVTGCLNDWGLNWPGPMPSNAIPLLNGSIKKRINGTA